MYILRAIALLTAKLTERRKSCVVHTLLSSSVSYHKINIALSVRKCCKFEYFITSTYQYLSSSTVVLRYVPYENVSSSRLSCHTGAVCIKLQYTERERYFAGLASPIKLQPMKQIHTPLAFLIAAETILFRPRLVPKKFRISVLYFRFYLTNIIQSWTN
jgi:hypothetical protein